MFVGYVRGQCADTDVLVEDEMETFVLIELGELGNMCSTLSQRRSVYDACCSIEAAGDPRTALF